VTGFDNRPPLRRQQIGAVATGPVHLPRLYKGKDRTFFMASFEPTRQLASNPGGPSNIRVPTERELNGDFSQSLVYFRNPNGTVRTEPWALLYNHFQRRPDGALALRPNPSFQPGLPASATNFRYQYRAFPLFNSNDADPLRRGRVLVDEAGRSLVNPVAQRIARELYPQPNITDPNLVADLLGANYSYFRRTEYVDSRYTIKIDHNLNDHHRLTGRWTEQPSFGTRQERDPIQHGLISDANTFRQLLLALTSTPRAAMTNEFRANYLYGSFGRNFPEPLLNRDYTNEYLNAGGAGAGQVNLLGYGMPRFFDAGTPRGASGQASGVGLATLGFNSPQDVGFNKEHSYSLTNDFSWVTGSMTLEVRILRRALAAESVKPRRRLPRRRPLLLDSGHHRRTVLPDESARRSGAGLRRPGVWRRTVRQFPARRSAGCAGANGEPLGAVLLPLVEPRRVCAE